MTFDSRAILVWGSEGADCAGMEEDIEAVTKDEDLGQSIDLNVFNVIEIDLFESPGCTPVYKSPSSTCMHLGDYAGSKSPRLESIWRFAWSKPGLEAPLS